MFIASRDGLLISPGKQQTALLSCLVISSGRKDKVKLAPRIFYKSQQNLCARMAFSTDVIVAMTYCLCYGNQSRYHQVVQRRHRIILTVFSFLSSVIPRIFNALHKKPFYLKTMLFPAVCKQPSKASMVCLPASWCLPKTQLLWCCVLRQMQRSLQHTAPYPQDNLMSKENCSKAGEGKKEKSLCWSSTSNEDNY